jgi:hypothetical protein
MDNAAGPSDDTEEQNGPTSEQAPPAAEDPHCIYFYYLTPGEPPHADVVGFIHDQKRPIAEHEVDQIIGDLAADARKEDHGGLVAVAHFFEDITWVRQSYIAIVLDSANHTLSLRDVSISRSGHTILDGREVILNDSELSGVRYRNPVIRKTGKWSKKKDQKERFRVRIHPRVRVGAVDPSPRSHDDSATNLGPPLPPP